MLQEIKTFNNIVKILEADENKANRLAALKNAKSDNYYKGILDDIAKNVMVAHDHDIDPNISIAKNYYNYSYEGVLENTIANIEDGYYDEEERDDLDDDDIEQMARDSLNEEEVFENAYHNLAHDVVQMKEGMDAIFGDNKNFEYILKRYLKDVL